MIQDPFKLHPLPKGAGNEWDDQDSLEPDDDDDAPPAAALPVEQELQLTVQLFEAHLALSSLQLLAQSAAHLQVLQGIGQAQERIRTLVGQLRHYRSDLRVQVEVLDGGVQPPAAQKLELTRLPVLVGRDHALCQLPLQDAEVPPLRGYFFQVGRNLIYQDLGGAGGTLLERRVGGKIKLINLKGEPAPLIQGDRLILGSVETHVVIQGIRPGPLGAGMPPVEGPPPGFSPLAGLSPAWTDAPPIAPAPPAPVAPAPGAETSAPAVSASISRPAGAPSEESSSQSASRTPQIMMGAIAVVSGLVGIFIGQLMAPPPPAPTRVAAPTPAVAAAPVVVEKRIGSSLELSPDGSLRLKDPKLASGLYFFLMTGADAEQPDPYTQGQPFALGQVTGDNGEARIVYAPIGLTPTVLAAAPAVAVAPDDQRISLFTALQSLQAGQLQESEKLLNMLATGTEPPTAAFKALGYLALGRNDLPGAQKHLRAALERDASDPETHFLLGRLARIRFNSLAITDSRRALLFDDARSGYEESLRQWLLPPSGAFAWRGHELGLKGEDLLDDYFQLLTRMALTSADIAAGVDASGSGTGTGTGTPSLTNPPAGLGMPAQGTGVAVAPTPAPPPPSDRPSEHVTVRISGGAFIMGGDETDTTDERGLKGPITLRTFHIDRFEVSNQQLERVFPEHKEKRGLSQGDKDPAVNVTWDEAQTYCRSVGMRLPTEAEWEKASRGTDGRTWPWGEGDPRPGVLNYKGAGVGRPTGVDSYPEGASPYGAVNMAGNVWEWTSDWYDPGWYSKAPAGGAAGPNAGTRKSIRGGSYADDAADARTSNRASAAPGSPSPKIGFRCARD